jgi:hypothetical protein
MRKYLIATLLAFAATFAFAIPFSPTTAGTITHTCTNSTARLAVAAAISGQTQLEVQNVSTVTIFVEPGDVTVTAAVATGYPVLAGQSKLITVTSNVTHVACIAASGSNTLYVTVGRGD